MSTLAGRKKARVYVDGFNLYYGAFNEGPHGAFKWLDLSAYCKDILRAYDIDVIRYFTARVKPRDGDMGPVARQSAYLRALETCPDISIHYGSYYTCKKWRPLAHPPKGGRRFVEIIHTEEKGSDVNLAAYLLLDAFKGLYESAFVISDDSDLIEPMRLVKAEFSKELGVLRVRTNRGSVFKSVADVVYNAGRQSYYSKNQFPNQVIDKAGNVITRPASW